MRMVGFVAGAMLLAGGAAAAVDPTGDNFNTPGPDLVGFSACQTATTLNVLLEFAGPIVPPPSGAANSLYGYVDLDLDRNAGTGGQGRTDDFNPGGALSGLGVEALVDLGSYDAGQVAFLVEANPPIGIPATFGAQSVSVAIPLPIGDAPDGVALATVIGNESDPTDVAPNAGSITSVSCCGNGVVDAGEDCDGAACCAADCTFADGIACGGDACTQAGTCNAGTCENGPPIDCNDGDPCFDDACVPLAGCAHVDRTGLPGATCAFDRQPPTPCADQDVNRAGFEKARALVVKAAANAKKQKSLLKKARKRVKVFVKQIGRLEKKDKVTTECASGLRAQADDAIARIERARAGG